MRTDRNLARPSFRFSEEWRRRENKAPLTPQIDRRLQGGQLENGKYVVHSLSGNERNHYFANRGGKQFEDLSALSGADNPADSRGFALLDYDHDGWQDLALVNANEPLFNLYRNQLGEQANGGNVIALRFIGGSRIAVTSSAEKQLACRDGYGAKITADLGDLTILREHRCGEGFGVQNSATVILGIGARESVRKITVHWPSGNSQSISNVAAGTLLVAYEDITQSPSKTPFEQRAYHDLKPGDETPSPPVLADFPLEVPKTTAPLRVYTTMATWCVACQSHLPQLRALKTGLGGEAELIGLPIDPEDDAEKLAEYVEVWKPAYRLRADLPAETRKTIIEFLTTEFGREPALPTTIITNRAGKVLKTMSGVPDVSTVRRIAAEH